MTRKGRRGHRREGKGRSLHGGRVDEVGREGKVWNVKEGNGENGDIDDNTCR